MFTASRALLTKASPVLLFLAPTPSFAEPSFEEPSPSSTPTIVAASWFSALKPDEPATGATAATPATVPAAKAKARAKAKAVPAPDWTAILNKAYSEATTGAFNEASHTVSLGLGNSVKSLTATGVPNQITSGFVSGFAAGYALKKIGKFAMFVAGAGFVGMQVSNGRAKGSPKRATSHPNPKRAPPSFTQRVWRSNTLRAAQNALPPHSQILCGLRFPPPPPHTRL